MQSILLTPPTLEPVTVADAKVAARLDGAHWDAIVADAIAGARQVAEHQTGLHFMEQIWRVELTDWPAADQVLRFYRPTAVAVSYWNGSTWAELDAAAFVAPAQDRGFVLASALGTSWPTLGEVAAGPRVRVDVTVGATDTAAVPPAAVSFIKAMVAVLASDPTLTALDAMGTKPTLPRLLDPIRLYG